MNNEKKVEAEPDANRDPITGAPGAHPVGVGVGSAGGAAVGAVVGSFAGPVGTAVGAAVGGVVGGLSGKGVAESVNPTVEDSYWREHYSSRPYVKAGSKYQDYQAAYRHGWEGHGRYGELNWDKAEPRMRDDWKSMGETGVDWDKASPAAKDAWDRLRGDHTK
jgi:Glycine zipper